jgi:ribosomal protein L15
MIENNQLNIQLNEQNKEIEVLTGKLDEIVGNYNEYSEKYKKEGEHWVEEIKRVKVILEGTTFNVRKKVEKNDNRAD